MTCNTSSKALKPTTLRLSTQKFGTAIEKLRVLENIFVTQVVMISVHRKTEVRFSVDTVRISDGIFDLNIFRIDALKDLG